VISGPKAVVILACAATLMARAAFAQVGVTEPKMVIVTVAAPVFASAYESELPLQVAKIGSRLKVIDSTPGWYRVEFKDPQMGRQTGFIQIRNVRPATAEYHRMQPVDLSVSDRESDLEESGRTGRQVATPTPIEPATAPHHRTAVRENRPDEIEQSEALRVPQKSSASKFFVGVGAEGNAIAGYQGGISTTTDSGRGVGFVLGYGFGPRWSLYSDFSAASINATDGSTYSLAHVDIGTRVHFLAGTHKVVPFVQVGLSGRAISQDIGTETFAASGAGVAFGGGLNAHFTPAFAFSAAVTWSVGDFTNFTRGSQSVTQDAVSATSARVHLGVIWFPGASSR
jgi:hypothetical protein